MSRTVIIDTDPGIDDAIAILFALAHPDIEVAAITTVAGNIGIATTTRNALRLVAFAGAAVPVHAGATGPLRRDRADETAIHGSDGLGGVVLAEPAGTAAPTADGEPAHAALVRLVDAAPAGSLDILALGPLTNIARLVDSAPASARRIGRLIAMGGAIGERGNVGPRAEFNIAHDPEAAATVLAAGLPLTLVPLDVTRRVRADGGYLDRLAAAGTPSADAVRRLIAAYAQATTGGVSRPLHDPCVPLLAVRPDLFRCERLRLAVDCGHGEDAGALIAGDSPVDVAMGVDAPAALDLLAETLELFR